MVFRSKPPIIKEKKIMSCYIVEPEHIAELVKHFQSLGAYKPSRWWNLYKGEITFKELRNLATLGQKVKKHKSKEPKHRKSLPKRATPAKN